MGWGTGNLGGGSGGLNFKIVGGTSEPSNPKENTIWVNTDQNITSYILSATEPETPEDGMVLITIGTDSAVAFSVTKKNPVMVYPISAKQYVGGAWVDVTVESYQNGEWKPWFIYLYNNGDKRTEVTGGWKTGMKYNTANVSTNGLTFNADNMQITGSSVGGYLGSCGTINKINLSGHRKLNALVKLHSAAADSNMLVCSQLEAFFSYKLASKALPTTESVISIDISNIESGYIVFSCGVNVTATIKSVWLE